MNGRLHMGLGNFYKTRTEQVMKPANVEITMGHNIGVSKSYYKPTEREVMEDYLKAADLLTISNNNLILQKEVAELQQKSENNEYVIRGKLQEKDEEIKTIKEQFNNMQSQLQGLMSAIGHVSESDKKEIAKQLIENGMHKQSTDAVSVS
jgi:predicted transcriptional regulator